MPVDERQSPICAPTHTRKETATGPDTVHSRMDTKLAVVVPAGT